MYTYMCSLDVLLKKNSPPDYIRQMIISANWLLKYRMQASYFRLICLSSAVLKAGGKSSRKQSSGKACALYTATTM